MPCCFRLSVLLGIAWAFVPGEVVAQQFLLRVPGRPELDSRAELSHSGLRVLDAAGNVFEYRRAPEADRRDGQFWGYYCREVDKYLRWPTSGQGAMFLGKNDGRAIAWQESRMQIVPMTPARGGEPLRTRSPATRWRAEQAGEFAVLQRGQGDVVLAQVDAEGRLQFYLTDGDRWVRKEADLAERLEPRAPLVLFANQAAELPDVLFVDRQGRLNQVIGGRDLRQVPTPGLPPLATFGRLFPRTEPGRRRMFTFDRQGRLWMLDLDHEQFDLVENRPGRLLPRGGLAVADRGPLCVAAIDAQGDLIAYLADQARGWSGPEGIASGLVPGGDVSFAGRQAVDGGNVLYFAAADANGIPRLFARQAGRWIAEVPAGLRFAPGAPIGLADTDGGIGFSAIDRDGLWRFWRHDSGTWTANTIADGFPPSARIVLLPGAGYGFAVDRRGRLVAARHAAHRWHCAVCSPGYRFAPQLVSRRIAPRAALPPATLQLVNQRQEPLVVKIVDRRSQNRPVELRIEPGKAVSFDADRDAGAVLEEVYLVPGPLGTLVEQVQQYPLPAQPIYDLVVYADCVTSVYFDRTKNRSDTPDKVSKSWVSIGAFPLPPGDILKSGDSIDVFAEASYQRNPGAAVWFGPPID